MGICLSGIRFGGKLDGRQTEERILNQPFRELGLIALLPA